MRRLLPYFTVSTLLLLLTGPAVLRVVTDHFGGGTAWSVEAAGLFRVERVRERWWLITPEGHGMIALGLNHLNELKNPADFSRTGFARRFGMDWPRVFAAVEEPIRGWGFNSAGFQAPPERTVKLATRLPGTWKLTDRLTGETLGPLASPVELRVPAGALRLLEARRE